MCTSCYISTVIPSAPITFKRLFPGGDPATAQEIVIGLGLHERSCSTDAEGSSRAPAATPPRAPALTPSATAAATPRTPAATPSAAGRVRPYVVLNMVATLDGRATVDGRSGPISDDADRALFHGLRTVVDAVMAGAGTVRAERYGPIVPDPDRRRLRARLGLRERPLACVVSAALTGLTPERVPLLGDPHSQVAIVTPSRESLPTPAAAAGGGVEYVRARRDDAERSLDLPAALAELQDRLHVRTLLCEGGPHLNAQLLAAGLVDELFLSISPMLAGGDRSGGEPAGGGPIPDHRSGGEPALGILAGPDLQPPIELELRSVLEHDSRLFLRYRVPAGG